MIVELLNHQHVNSLKNLFSNKRYMGVDHTTNYFLEPEIEFSQTSYDIFCDTYLSGLNNFKCFGSIDNNEITAIIAFYESMDTPDWYWTQIRSSKRNHIPAVLDKVVEYNELVGRLKFYSLFNKKYVNVYRRLAFSKALQQRYGYFDEFYVPAKTKCHYITPWQILFNRTLLPVDSVLRCTYLKQEYRHDSPIAGTI